MAKFKPQLMNDARSNFNAYLKQVEKGRMSADLALQHIMLDFSAYLDEAYKFGRKKGAESSDALAELKKQMENN